ncbi:MAG: hypothetical protein ACI910_000346 [Oleispira sp.]|jgi:hypothetical protein
MRSIVKNPIVWIGVISLIMILAAVSVRFYKEVNTADGEAQAIEQVHTIGHAEEVIPADGHHSNSNSNSHSHSQADIDNQAVRHEDMLSEEMKQAIRDKLLFHGSMEVIQHPDGSIELPSNGRFTQMPVAVEMPDGSIQIKEYSKLPE